MYSSKVAKAVLGIGTLAFAIELFYSIRELLVVLVLFGVFFGFVLVAGLILVLIEAVSNRVARRLETELARASTTWQIAAPVHAHAHHNHRKSRWM
jgi:uncharacterized membrane protein YedE/YeeE